MPGLYFRCYTFNSQLFMKKLLLSAFSLFFLTKGASAQLSVTKVQENYLVCQTWGFLKYFHSEVSTCAVNWDSVLVSTLSRIDTTASTASFNAVLNDMIDAAGPMAPAQTAPPAPEDARNQDFSWFSDPLLDNSVVSKLNVVKDNFRPHAGCYIDYGTTTGYLAFNNENMLIPNPDFPDSQYRRLVLFRYWNFIRYFNPNNAIMDRSWDATLRDFIGRFDTLSSTTSYHLSLLRMSRYLDDTHAAGAVSPYTRSYFGTFSLPVSLVEVDTFSVIDRVFYPVPGIDTGDVVLAFNGVNMRDYREQFRQYLPASNETMAFVYANFRFLRGPQNSTVDLLIQKADGSKSTVTLKRDMSLADYFAEYSRLSGPAWKITDCGYGYVNMGLLQLPDVAAMYQDLKNAPAIIFDVRNYPNGTMDEIAKYILPATVAFAQVAIPDVLNPGTYTFLAMTTGTFNPDWYQGKVYLLFNEKTQSHAEFTVMALEKHPNARKIGSQTSGADGNVTGIALPGGFSVSFSSIGVLYPDGTDTQRTGIVPDTLVRPTLKGIREHRDELMEAAFGNCRTVSITENDAFADLSAVLSPNPAVSDARLTLAGPEIPSGAVLLLTDLTGRQVRAIPVNSRNVTIERGGLSKGLYFYSLVRNGERLAGGRLVFE
jgi:carboxyl-terminal processing protease